jgi:type IV fimbrial biogenesis protein FimT
MSVCNSGFAPRNRQAGFNLLELMVTMTIAAVVLGVGIPSFSEFLANNRMASAANDLVSAIHVTRTEAVKRRATVTLCGSSNWAAANPACDLASGTGWIVFFDADGDASVDAGDTVLQAHAPLATGVTFDFDAGASRYLQYGGNGFPQQSGGLVPITNILLCDDRGNATTGKDSDGSNLAAGRWIAIGVTGRPQIYRSQALVQASPVGGC